MKLRSGFQTEKEERLYCCPKALLRQIYLLEDIDEHHDRDWFLSKVKYTRGNLNYIDEYSREKLLSMDVIWLKNIYCNCVEIIKRQGSEAPSSPPKVACRRFVYALFIYR